MKFALHIVTYNYLLTGLRLCLLYLLRLGLCLLGLLGLGLLGLGLLGLGLPGPGLPGLTSSTLCYVLGDLHLVCGSLHVIGCRVQGIVDRVRSRSRQVIRGLLYSV